MRLGGWGLQIGNTTEGNSVLPWQLASLTLKSSLICSGVPILGRVPEFVRGQFLYEYCDNWRSAGIESYLSQY